MKKYLVALALCLAAIANAASFTTRSFRTDVTIEKNRIVGFVETIDLTFTQPSHGIVRNIPYRTQANDGSSRLVEFVFDGTSLDTGNGFAEVPASKVQDGDDWVLKIGSPSARVSGHATYKIKYRVTYSLADIPAEGKLGARTEFLWNVLPGGWPTSIPEGEVTVHFPQVRGAVWARALLGNGGRLGVQRERGKAPVGGLDLLDLSYPDDKTLKIGLKREKRFGESLTVILALPKGTVSPGEILTEAPPAQPAYQRQRSHDAGSTNLGNPGWALLPLLLIPLGSLLRSRRDYFRGMPLVVQYDPPEGIGPGEAGYLLDKDIQPSHVSAGVLSIAQKGAAQFIPIGLDLKDEQGDRPLTFFEGAIYRQLAAFPSPISGTEVSNALGSAYPDLRMGIRSGPAIAPLMGKRGPEEIILAVAFLVLVSISFLFGILPGIGAVVLGLIVAVTVNSGIPKYTKEGARIRRHLEGLKEFISHSKEQELNYMVEHAPDLAMFERLLPYAVAFGAVTEWKAAFPNLDYFALGGGNGSGDMWYSTSIDDALYFADTSVLSFAPPTPYYSSDSSDTSSTSTFSSGSSGFGDTPTSDYSAPTYDSSSSGSGGFDSGSSAGDGGGGGGGDSW